MEMTLADIEKSYLESKDRKTQINILADLNEMETTTMALLLREMGLDVDQHKLPRTAKDGVDKYELFMLTDLYAEAKAYREERGRELGRVICNGQTEKKKNDRKRAELSSRKTEATHCEWHFICGDRTLNTSTVRPCAEKTSRCLSV